MFDILYSPVLISSSMSLDMVTAIGVDSGGGCISLQYLKRGMAYVIIAPMLWIGYKILTYLYKESAPINRFFFLKTADF